MDAEERLRNIAHAQQRVIRAENDLSLARAELRESALWKKAESAKRERGYAERALDELLFETMDVLQPPLQGMPASGEGGVRSVTIGDMTLTAHLPVHLPVEQDHAHAT